MTFTLTTPSSRLPELFGQARIFPMVALACLLQACGGSDGGNGNGVDAGNGGNPPAIPGAGDQSDNAGGGGVAAPLLALQVGTDANRGSNPFLQSLAAELPPQSNLSMRAGDAIVGSSADDLLIGGLGVDILIGGEGDDVLIGGTEDFAGNVDGDGLVSDNRDHALGQGGDDTFFWAPGDGSDFFDGGSGIDTVVFGLIGEAADSDGSTEGAPFFNVNPPNTEGTQNFDGIFVDETGLPQIQLSSSPGFCTVLESAEAATLASIGIDQLARFSLRGVANDFDAGVRSDDDGLRVGISLKNVEFVACTQREFVQGGSLEDNIRVIDISNPQAPVAATLADLPEKVQRLLR